MKQLQLGLPKGLGLPKMEDEKSLHVVEASGELVALLLRKHKYEGVILPSSTDHHFGRIASVYKRALQPLQRVAPGSVDWR